MERLAYVTAVTPYTFLSISLASSTMSVEIEPNPPRTPVTVVAPGTIIRTFVPRLAISAWTDAVAPWPKLTMATTAAMPITIPSIVRPVLMGFRLRMRRADHIVSQRKDMTGHLILGAISKPGGSFF